MRLQGVNDYDITYSEFGDTKAERKTMRMKMCFSKRHALDRFNILVTGLVYIHEIKEVA
jgi:hypothetical protein